METAERVDRCISEGAHKTAGFRRNASFMDADLRFGKDDLKTGEMPGCVWSGIGSIGPHPLLFRKMGL